jgi:hypothetical protein
MGFSITTVCFGPMAPFHFLVLPMLLAPMLVPFLLGMLRPERRLVTLRLDR